MTVLLVMAGNGRFHFLPSTIIAVLVAFTFRVFAVRGHWRQIVPLDAPAEGPAIVPVVTPAPVQVARR
jgi:hypothetical protein